MDGFIHDDFQDAQSQAFIQGADTFQAGCEGAKEPLRVPYRNRTGAPASKNPQILSAQTKVDIAVPSQYLKEPPNLKC